MQIFRDNEAMNSLDGIRILDLSRVLAGPWCTQTLADLGADVIKIERPGAGDDTRSWGPPFLKDAEGKETPEAAYYLGTNRNKRSLTCDISQAEGQALIRELVTHCDVFIENFKVGDMARYGLDAPSLLAINPRLVYCSVTGFGQTGPYSDRAGYDYAVQGMGGLMSVTGERDDLGGGPQKVGVAVADLFTGMYATVGILAALRHAERTGQGQHVDMALLDVQVAMLANLGANYLVSGKVPGRAGNAHQNIVPYQVFEVQAPEGSAPGTRDHIILAVGNDGQFAKFCAVAGRAGSGQGPALRPQPGPCAPPRRTRAAARRHPADTHQGRLALCPRGGQGACGAINNLAEVFADPHVRSREMVSTWQHPVQPDLRLVSSPLKMGQTPARQDLPPPLLGQHTQDVLSEVRRQVLPCRGLAHLERAGHQTEALSGRMLPMLDHPPLMNLGVAEHLGQVVDRAAGHLGCLQRRQPISLAAGFHDRF